MDGMPGQHTYKEIVGQAEAWAASLAAAEARAEELRASLDPSRGDTLFIGCGSTYYLSQSAAAIWRAWTGCRAAALPASEVWLFPDVALARPAPARLVAVSRSGETTETLRAVETYQDRTEGDWLSVGCYPQSSLGRLAPLSLMTVKAEEESVAQTRSFTSMLALTQALAGLAAGWGDLDPLAGLPDVVNALIPAYEPLARWLGETESIARFVFLGSGANYGLANEAMLKMKEMSLSPSEAFHFMEFRHGPKSVVGPDMLVVGLVGDAARAQEGAVLQEMRDLGAKVLTIAEGVEGLPADYAVELGSGMDAVARAPLYLPVLQLLAYYRAMAKGLNPDRPTNLDAVVRL
ncbi:MAG: SIS domain-containing protein [Anaerolineae bacterium]